MPGGTVGVYGKRFREQMDAGSEKQDHPKAPPLMLPTCSTAAPARSPGQSIPGSLELTLQPPPCPRGEPKAPVRPTEAGQDGAFISQEMLQTLFPKSREPKQHIHVTSMGCLTLQMSRARQGGGTKSHPQQEICPVTHIIIQLIP